MDQQIMKKFTHCLGCPVSRYNALKDLPDQVLHEFARCKSSTFYRRSQIIFHEMQHPYGVHCIGLGRIKETKFTSRGKRHLVRIVKPGDLLGYHSFLTHEPYSVTAEAMEDAVVCFLDQTLFTQALRNNPQFSMAMLSLLSKELKIAVDKSIEFAYHSLPERMAELLLTLRLSYGEEQKHGCFLDIDITREELASLLGSTVESTVRQITRMKQMGIIATDKKKLVIRNLEYLYDLAPKT